MKQILFVLSLALVSGCGTVKYRTCDKSQQDIRELQIQNDAIQAANKRMNEQLSKYLK